MSPRRRSLPSPTRTWSTLVLALTLIPASHAPLSAEEAAGAAGPRQAFARAETSPHRIDWTLTAPEMQGRLTLTVAGPEGFLFEKRFERGAPVAFDLAEIRDRQVPDGAYTYELRTAGKETSQMQSGFLTVRGGTIFVPASGPSTEAPKPSGPKPPTSLELKAIQGNSCIGAGCATGNEGTPLRLKDNFVRLDFTDDFDGFSVDHDWAIQANDAIGGGEYLSILDVDNSTVPFTVVAGAASDSIVISSSGKVGVGTSTPAVKLDAKVSASSTAVARIQNTSSSGYSAIEYLDQSGNVDLFFGIDNANNITRLNSVNNNPIAILTNSTERLRITSAGNLGIGTSSPSNKLDIQCNSSAATCGRVGNSSSTGYSGWEFTEEGGTVVGNISADNANNLFRINSIGNFPFVIYTESTERIRFPSPGGNYITAANGAYLSAGGTWTNASSRTLKQDIHDLDARAAFAALGSLNPVEFAYKAEPGEQHVGFIAEEVPALVAENDRQGLSPMDIVAVLTKVVQEQQKTIEALSVEVQALKQRP